MKDHNLSVNEMYQLGGNLPLVPEEADLLVAEGVTAMERGDEVEQDQVFAEWRAKYG